MLPDSRRLKLVVGAALGILVLGLICWLLYNSSKSAPVQDDPKAAMHGDRAKAEALVAEVVQRAPGDDMSGSLRQLGQAHEADPSWALPLVLRARINAANQREKEAAEDLDAAYKLDPSDPEAALMMLRNMLPTRPADEYERMARHVLELKPGSGEAHYLLALAILRSADQSKNAEALKELRESNRLAPNQSLALIEMGKLASLTGDQQLAVTSLLRAEELVKTRGQNSNPMEMAAQRRNIAFWLANTYRSLGRAADEKTWTDRAAKLSARLREIDSLRWKTLAKPPDPTAQQKLDKLLADPKFAEP